MPRFEDVTGRAFGRLLAVGFVGLAPRNGLARWECKCDCGRIVTVRGDRLRSGRTTSCGHHHATPFGRMNVHVPPTSGMRRHPLYDTWHSMVARCHLPTSQDFQWYGAAGVTVCERWRDVRNFVADMDASFLAHTAAHGRPDTTIERVDVARGYEPDNCRWATRMEQAHNTRRTRWVGVGGRRVSLAALARQRGVSVQTLANRVNRGWALDRALSTPVRGRRTAVAVTANA